MTDDAPASDATSDAASDAAPVVRFPQRGLAQAGVGAPVSYSRDTHSLGPSAALVERLYNAVPAKRREREGEVRVLPAQDTSLMTLDLPVRDARTRRAAAPFALEDRVAAPLERVHVVVGPRVDPARAAATYLVVVGDRARLAELARSRGPILPEALAIPRPPADPTGRPVWAAWRDGERVVVRAADGTGFAMRLDALEPLWSALGRPRLLSYGEALPASIDAQDLSADPPPPDPAEARLDLGEGLGRAGGVDPLRLLVRAAAVISIAVIGHLALLAADVIALDRLAARERASAQAAMAGPLPGLDVDLPAGTILTRVAPGTAEDAPRQGAFLPLMTRVSGALLGAGSEVTVRRLAFTAADGQLRLVAQGSGIEALQEVERVLRGDGLTVRSGIATSGQGGAEAELTVVNPDGGTPR